ncbi:hypothetical protein IG631_01427 [Alternaria alternata]|nr:hypothetical protein IG631_01427 [Alternaria alternata]
MTTSANRKSQLKLTVTSTRTCLSRSNSKSSARRYVTRPSLGHHCATTSNLVNVEQWKASPENPKNNANCRTVVQSMVHSVSSFQKSTQVHYCTSRWNCYALSCAVEGCDCTTACKLLVSWRWKLPRIPGTESPSDIITSTSWTLCRRL